MSAQEIPLSDVAEDARASISAFREAGAVSFQDLEPAESRANYRVSCRANGPAHRGEATVFGARIAGVACRVYRAPGTADGVAASNPGARPGAVLFFHGGGWVIGDLDSHDALCRTLAETSGTTVIAVDYRRAPEYPFPAAHDDAIAVASHLLGAGVDGAEEPRLADPSRIVLAGDSAGGNLAAWVAAEAARGRFAHRPTGQVLFYPVTDLTGSRGSYSRIVEGFPLTAASMRWFADQYAPVVADRARAELSPLLHPVPRGQAPAFIGTVGLDPLADEGVAYAMALADAGIRIEHHHLPRHPHGLMTAAGRIESGRWLLDRAAAFVRARLRDRGAAVAIATSPAG